eukprot:GHVS01072241.1.p1 GENE.GHVS01072241.1~~GHVS01072241.1.p1  ORF type:complete len:634 (-),score=127.25 GHVS01072241.1:199-2100(-)
MFPFHLTNTSPPPPPLPPATSSCASTAAAAAIYALQQRQLQMSTQTLHPSFTTSSTSSSSISPAPFHPPPPPPSATLHASLAASVPGAVATSTGVFFPLPPALEPNASTCASRAGVLSMAASLIGDAELEEDKDTMRCHLHSKPQLSCKFCRKYKRSVHNQARLAQAQMSQMPSEDKKNAVEMTNTTTFNVNNLLRENIMSSEYFKSLYTLKTYTEVVDEIYQFADHAEPYCAGNSRAPSTLFCCIYKFFMMKLTDKQVSQLLDHVDSPYIRCAGFLFLRYIHPPEKLWSWYEPYFIDNEEFTPGADKQRITTMGEYVETLITEDKYFSTVLPRLPVKIKNQYGAQLIAMDEHRARKRENLAKLDEISAYGTSVDACSNGDWLEGIVINVVDNGPGRTCLLIKLEDDSQEEIDIGLVSARPPHVDLPPIEENEDEENGGERKKRKKRKHHRHRSRSRDRADRNESGGEKRRKRSRSPRHHRRHSPHRRHSHRAERRHEEAAAAAVNREDASRAKQPKTQEELLEEFRRREREKALASGKDYARRPTSYKSSLSLKIEMGTTRRKSRSSSPLAVAPSSSASRRAPSPEKKKVEPSVEHRQKMAQLMQKYNRGAADEQGKRNTRDVETPDVMRLG